MSLPSSESSIRLHIIDQQLERAGWSVSRGNLRKEFRLTSPQSQLREVRVPYTAAAEFADYVLLGRDDKPLAIVEAKRTSRDAYAGKRQAADYADRVKTLYGVEPFIFLCNGNTILFWDRAQAAPRLVSGFFTIDDLERLAFQRRYRQPLGKIGPKAAIVDRPYQVEAVRRVTEGLEREQRKFLLVLATGTGKTRIAIALTDLLVRANWVQRVLFLADRRELVRQALDDFETFLPTENCARIEGRAVDDTARIHVATYPSMLRAYRQLSPGYYDLVIADESHRSIYQRYRVLFEHFDALQLGLTATPVDFMERNTFELFDCPTGLPTFSYPFETAVREGYLADYRVLDTQTNYQIEGIKAGQLPAELQQQLEAQGVDLDDLDFEGSDLERSVINTGTNDALVQEFLVSCRKDATGTLPAKSIMFAMSHRHAMNILESFQRLRPDLTRRGVIEVIDSHMERVEKLIEDFKRRDMPRVAISVEANFGAAGTWMWERLYTKGGRPTKLSELAVAVVDYAKTHPDLRQAALDSFDNDTSYHQHIDDTAFRFQYEVLVEEDARDLIRPLMEAFYENLLASGFPQCVHGLAYDFHRDAFVRAFWDANPELKVCPTCGGLRPDAIDEKRFADTDHFLPKSIYPFLSVHAANLLPICVPCNRSFKLGEDAGDDGVRVDPLDEAANAPLLHTFLPYLRPAFGVIDVQVSRDDNMVHRCNITDEDGTTSRRVNNLNRVLRLKKRWEDRLPVIIGEIYNYVTALGRRDRRRWGDQLTEQDLRDMAEELVKDRDKLIRQQPEFLLRESYLRFVLENEDEFAALFTVYIEPAS